LLFLYSLIFAFLSANNYYFNWLGNMGQCRKPEQWRKSLYFSKMPKTTSFLINDRAMIVTFDNDNERELK
jgi:hypothetical protein